MIEENKNFQEIAKEAHVSFNFISMVKKKMLGEDTTINKKIIDTITSTKAVFRREFHSGGNYNP